jgi:small subunit ribosomal protein S9
MASKENVYYATGRRKTSSARIFLKPGKGKHTINDLPFDEFIKRKTGQMVMMQPLELTSLANKLDVQATVSGGGEASQAGALRHGIARALLAFNPELRPVLKKAGYLTRDPRAKERKKYGLRGARRRYQYSKR